MQACPYLSVVVEAPSCGRVTRSRLEVVQEAGLRWIEAGSLPEGNCLLHASSLPPELFLEREESYSFTAHFVTDSSALRCKLQHENKYWPHSQAMQKAFSCSLGMRLMPVV